MIQGNSDLTPNKSEENDNENLDLEENGVTKKEPGAFRTISEVADEIHVPQHVLRFWETRFSQLQPIKRSGGRRYYRVEDVTLLKYISELLYVQGYTIKGVQRLLKEDFSRFNKAKKNTTDEEQLNVSNHSEVKQSDASIKPAMENNISLENQNDSKNKLEIEKLRQENAYLTDALRGILVELQELRKIIVDS